MQEYSAPKKMKRVGDLFERYKKHFVAPQATVEKACSKAIKEVCGFDVSADTISYTVSTNTIALQVPSVLKSEIKFHHTEILSRLQQELGEKGSPKIIL
jgi:hypothetical protein